MEIQWAVNSYLARALSLLAQRTVNFFAEAAPKDAKSPVALLNTPGIKAFCNSVGPGPIRGMEVMDDILYVVSGDELWSVKPGCDNTALGSIGVGAGSSTSSIAGVTRPAEVLFTITGGTDGGGSISSITIGGDEILPEGGITFLTDAATTAELFVSERPAPVFEGFTYDASGNNPTVTSFEATVPAGWDVGDLMVAQVSNSSSGVSGINTFSGPVGWTEVAQETMSGGIAAYLNEKLGTDSIWFKFMAEGDGDNYTWTSSESIQIQIAISRISGAARVQGLGPGLFPSAIAFRESDTAAPGFGGSGVDVPIVPSITPPSTNSLLLMLMGVPSDQAQATRYVVDPLYPLQTKQFHKTATMTPFPGISHTIHCYSEVWAEYKATDIRTISAIETQRENVWHLAVSSWLTHPDYDIIVNTEGSGSVIIRRKPGAGGTPEDFNGLEVVITTTGDVTVACG